MRTKLRNERFYRKDLSLQCTEQTLLTLVRLRVEIKHESDLYYEYISYDLYK